MSALLSRVYNCDNRLAAAGTMFHGCTFKASYSQLSKLLGPDLGPTLDRRTQHEWVLEVQVLGKHRPITTIYDSHEATSIADNPDSLFDWNIGTIARGDSTVFLGYILNGLSQLNLAGHVIN